MSKIPELMARVLELPRSDRSYLASKLIESLEESEQLTPEFRAQLDERVLSWKGGRDVGVSSEELQRDIQQILSR